MVGSFYELEGKTFLICVGAMRCATSWIHRYLASLPGVAVSPIKEVHYFNAKFPTNALSDADVLALKRLGLQAGRTGNPVDNLLLEPVFQASIDRAQMIYDDEAYFGHFARLCAPETFALCDITPAYAVIGRPGFQYMKNFVAAQGLRVKILFLMRDPLDRLWSQLRHMQHLNPAAAVATRWPEAIRSAPIMARADYRATIEDLDATFFARDILYLFYEDLFTEASLRRLSHFIGADHWPGNTDERANASMLEQGLPEGAREAFLDALAPQYAFCRDRFDGQVPACWAA
ncbi:MAG: sulfotransferase [Alphaproteobacteria bacterium]|nr:sulfotransferase [Alphaproteobacteria bacterium]MCB9946205.1 sulfotransferase [Rhodospirillaceae bacterium]